MGRPKDEAVTRRTSRLPQEETPDEDVVMLSEIRTHPTARGPDVDARKAGGGTEEGRPPTRYDYWGLG